MVDHKSFINSFSFFSFKLKQEKTNWRRITSKSLCIHNSRIRQQIRFQVKIFSPSLDFFFEVKLDYQLKERTNSSFFWAEAYVGSNIHQFFFVSIITFFLVLLFIENNIQSLWDLNPLLDWKSCICLCLCVPSGDAFTAISLTKS